MSVDRDLACPPVRQPLPPARPGEVLPRRDHAAGLMYVAFAGMFALLAEIAVLVGSLESWWTVWPALAVTGFAAGHAQARWLWKGTVPRHAWAGSAAAGWLAGGGMGWLYLFADRGASPPVVPDWVLPWLYLSIGPVAGAVAGVGQARILRARGLPWRWWVAASAGAAGIAWIFLGGFIIL